jgi:uncharacterized protein (TIGR03435 family)
MSRILKNRPGGCFRLRQDAGPPSVPGACMRKLAGKIAGTFGAHFLWILAAIALAAMLNLPRAPAAAQAPTAQTPTAPQWQVDAGGKMAFDVASVKQNKSGAPPSGDREDSNFPLGPGNMYTPNGGLFTAQNFPLLSYITFAYKMNTFQVVSFAKLVPKWVLSERFDIQARAQGNATKDQMRVMMQALLADRFKLAIHAETQQAPIFALVLLNPGKTGPQLQPYPDGTPCDASIVSTPTATGTPSPSGLVAGQFPQICGGYANMRPSTPGRLKAGARNVTIQVMADQFPALANDPDRPVFDRTGLTGTYDFAIEFTPQFNGPLPPGVNFQPDPTGPTFLEALKEQLGLKLDPQTGPVDVFILDQVEEPTAN